ncbi:hypothetical protein NFI96_027974 [Prochilodus magdalenae]|nr:hypothetical protein NFI96_027974 [Prochilodus magdalenae]
MAIPQPKLILLFSGKRKSGKDYVTSLIQERLGPHLCCILRLSGPLKAQYAQDHGLDFEQLLSAGQYKEKYRADMIQWGESKRQQDPGFFCRLSICGASQPVWLVPPTFILTVVPPHTDLLFIFTKTKQDLSLKMTRCHYCERLQTDVGFTVVLEGVSSAVRQRPSGGIRPDENPEGLEVHCRSR